MQLTTSLVMGADASTNTQPCAIRHGLNTQGAKVLKVMPTYVHPTYLILSADGGTPKVSLPLFMSQTPHLIFCNVDNY